MKNKHIKVLLEINKDKKIEISYENTKIQVEFLINSKSGFEKRGGD